MVLPPRQQNVLRVKGLNMVLIVMLMCSEMGEIITPSGMERLREDGGTKKRSRAIEAGGNRLGYFNECT